MSRTVIDDLELLFGGEGAESYLGEALTQAEHMIQAALLAEEAGAPDGLVAAALLHDVGHFELVGRPPDKTAGQHADQHAELGAAFLAHCFGPEVSEPVRLHVAAKRYLCALEPDYFHRLSPASVQTLSVQGGAMQPDETAAFEIEAYHADAVRLRRLDEAAKDPARRSPPFARFRPLLERLLGDSQDNPK